VPGKSVTAKFERVWDVPIEISVEVARTKAPLGDTLNLRPGSIVPLNRLASQPVEVRAGGRVLAVGEVVVIDEEFGVRITDMAGDTRSAGGAAPVAPESPGAGFDPAPVDSAAALADLAAWQAEREDA
jgi:flagellar motor switch protein FliN/FliY